MAYYRELDSIVESLKRAKKEGIKVNLLIGAGCSATAGIPMASGMIDEIKKEYSAEIDHISEKTYSNYMAKLTPIERRKLINRFVKDSKVNWAHIGMAQMMKENYVHRVLTTNFDNIFLRACSLIGEFPGIYDMTTYGGNFRSDLLSEKSILYLHGQHTSFVLCNTDSEVDEQKKNLQDTFNELKRNSMWIIVGYSCTNDAIWQLLSSEPSFENRLYLIGYENTEENENMKKILSEDKYAFYVKGYNSDSFFIEIMKELDIFPPQIIDKPFSYLRDTINSITEYENETTFYSNKLNRTALEILEDAIENYEDDNIRMYKYYFQLGLYGKAFDMLENLSYGDTSKILNFVKEHNNKASEKIKAFIEKMNKCEKIDTKKLPMLIEAINILSLDLSKVDNQKIELIKQINNIYEKFKIGSLDYYDINNWSKCIILLIEFNELDKALESLIKIEKIYKEKLKNNKEDIVILNALSKLYLKMIKYDEDNSNKYIDKILESMEKAYMLDKNNISVNLRWGTYLLNIIQLDELEWERFYTDAKNKFREALDIADTEDEVRIKSIFAENLFDTLQGIQDEEIQNIALKEFFDLCFDIYEKEELEQIIKFDLEEKIVKIIRMLDLKKYKKYIIEYRKIIENILEKCDKEREISDLVIKLNNIAYYLIEINEFELSGELLEICLKFDNNCYVNATKGLWHFKNDNLHIEIREKNGKINYKKAIELCENETDLQVAIRQKYYYEYAIFLKNSLNNTQEAEEYIGLALKFGKAKENPSTYLDIRRYMKENNIKIKEIDFFNEEVAVE